MKMLVCLVLFAAFALPAAFAAQQDVITLQAYEERLKNGAAYGMTKTVISNPVLEEALVTYSKEKLGGIPSCGETCLFGRCYVPGCTCNIIRICVKKSLEQNSNKVGEEALVDFARKGLAAGLAN